MKVNHIKKRLPPYNDKSSLSIPSRQNLPVYKKQEPCHKNITFRQVMTELLKTVICSNCSFWYMLIHPEIRHGPDWRSLQSVIYYSHTETEKRMAWMSTQSEEYKRNSSGLLPGITIVHHTTVNLVVWWNSNILRTLCYHLFSQETDCRRGILIHLPGVLLITA